jgi:hypothetical protein
MSAPDESVEEIVIERGKARLALASAVLNAARALSELESIAMACARALDEEAKK